MKAGDTYLVVARSYNHLYVVISDPAQDREKVVIVNFTTWTPSEEQHCIIKAGEHPFVKHKTAVRYKDAKIVTVKHLADLAKAALMAPREPVSRDLLRRVREGAAASDFLPEGCRKLLDDQGLLQ